MTILLLERYAKALETLNADSLARLEQFVSPEIHFTDPFQDVTGWSAMQAIFSHMFESVDNLRFTVLGQAVAQGGMTGYIRWRLTGHLKAFGGRTWTVNGMSEIRFDQTGRIVAHHDYWDPAHSLYEHIPIIGTILRLIRRRIARAQRVPPRPGV